jgi:hypothetical protein
MKLSISSSASPQDSSLLQAFILHESIKPRDSTEGQFISFGFLSMFVSLRVHCAAWDGDLEALRDRIAQGDDIDGGDGYGWTPLIRACFAGHLECAQALIDAGAAVDVVSNVGYTALTCACFWGHHVCAQALIDAGAAVDQKDDDGETALMRAVECPSFDDLDTGESVAESDVDEDSDDDSDVDEEELEQRSEARRQQRQNRMVEEVRQGRARCVQALLEAMAPIKRADFRVWAALLAFACERLQLLCDVLATSHVIEHAPELGVLQARVVTLTADAQGIITESPTLRAPCSHRDMDVA